MKRSDRYVLYAFCCLAIACGLALVLLVQP
jgi:hypothetical protein